MRSGPEPRRRVERFTAGVGSTGEMLLLAIWIYFHFMSKAERGHQSVFDLLIQ